MKYIIIICICLSLVLSLTLVEKHTKEEKTKEVSIFEIENKKFKEDLLESIHSFSNDTIDLYIPEWLE